MSNTNTPERRDEARVPLARLWKKTSKAGTVYFSGPLGRARLLIFPSTDAEGERVLDLVVVPGGEQRPRPTPTEALAERPDAAPSEARKRVLGRVTDPHPRSAWAAPTEQADGEIPF